MRKGFTLFVFLMFCKSFFVSASVGSILQSRSDTPKTDIKLTLKDTLKTLASLPDSSTVKVTNYTKRTDSVSAHPYFFNVDTLNMSALLLQADSVRLLEAVRLTDSLNQEVLIKKQDSVKWTQYKLLKDSVKRSLKAVTLDSLKIQLKQPENYLFKGPIYGEIALRYLDYDTLSNKRVRSSYQSEVIGYTMKALHQFSYYNDTAGLRACFDNLAKVYIAQKKYSQAKWFILQSNSLSRAKKDPANIISSLVTLATIKSEQNDYTLAMKDLNEAIQIAVTYHYPKLQSDVLRHYALLYSRMKNYPKEEMVLKKRDSLEETIRKDEEARLMANVATKDSIEIKKADSLQAKKKVFTSSTRKLYKNSSARKTASL